MEKRKSKIYVVGHKNPDTDSICSAIAYAWLKTAMTGDEYSPRRAGQLNEETQYVLNKFQVKPPALLANVKLQVKDLNIRDLEGISPKLSIREAWITMKENNIKTLPVVEGENLVGVISTGDIARSYMEVHDATTLAAAKTRYQNIVDTLDGTLVTGNPHGFFMHGKIAVGASNEDKMAEFIKKDDLVILGNRSEAQACAIDLDVSCLVLCAGSKLSPELTGRARERSIVVITTPHDAFTAARLINQSIPVKYFMSRGPLVTFRLTDYVDDIKPVMTSKKYRDFPILDGAGRFKGFISRRRFMDSAKKRVILVDHNEKSQAVDGIEEAEIVEIIDHHRLGSLETLGPVYFRNQPVGCTATIITQLYEEAGVSIPAKMAALLCSAIISDTLLFRSPTATPLDEAAGQKLAALAGIEPTALAQEMFHAGSSLAGKSAREIALQDFKQFTVDTKAFGVGQISSLDTQELAGIRTKLEPYLPKLREEKQLEMIYFMLTNILNESSEIICVGQGARGYISEAFDVPPETEPIILPGVVSRKKQLIPNLVAALQQ